MKILIVGASGVNGYAVTQHFKNNTEWDYLTLSRSPLYYEHDKSKHLQINLLEFIDCDEYKDQLKQVTHIFYAALKPNTNAKFEADENERMFENAIKLVRKYWDKLEHITFLQGGKVYGAHLGTYKTPAREDQSRHFPPNLYFRHEDYSKKLSTDTKISYTALRPDVVIGYSLHSAMNLGNLIGVYATICKESGMDFIFPGDAETFSKLANVTDSDIVAKAVEWSFNNEKAKNKAFNITNGDVFRWEQVWERIADYYDLKVGYPQPISLEDYFDYNEERWSRLVDDHHLKELRIRDIAKGNFGDFIFNVGTDAIFNVNEARRNDFNVMNRESPDSILNHIKYLQKESIIPTY